METLACNLSTQVARQDDQALATETHHVSKTNKTSKSPKTDKEEKQDSNITLIL